MNLQKPALFVKSLNYARPLAMLALVSFILSMPAFSAAQCPAPGDQTTYGDESWIGYVYFGTPSAYSSNPPSNPFATEYYAGYLNQTPHFVQDYEYDAVWGSTICGGQNNNFAIRYKMRKYYAAGTYTFTVGGDDGYRLSIDGGATYLISNWADHGYATSSASVTLAAGYYHLVFEYYENAVGSKVSYFDSSCGTYSTAPTTISGNLSICKGSTTTLTASGGVEAPGATYQWGYSTTAGYYVITGQTGSSVTIGPNQSENIWVRRIDAGACSNTTLPAKTFLTVVNPSTAPTTISGTASICPGESTTLTASGGTSAPGSAFQWGTGNIGENIIAGQTGASITVSPSATTTYWVRRVDNSPCGSTTAISRTVTVSGAPGNPSVFGDNVWNMYGYKNADINLTSATYTGYYVQDALSFNTQSGSTAWNSDYSPSSAAGWNGCSIPNDNFTFVHKRQGFPCGIYTVTMTNWDDSCVIYINGVQQWFCQNWSYPGSCNGYVGQFALDGNSTIEVRTAENGGGAHAGISLVNNSVEPTAPTSISGNSAICQGTSATLTASGGTLGSGSYQWGTGTTPGLNILSGQTAASITVSPSADTTYWVRRVFGSPCTNFTDAATLAVSVTVPPGDPVEFGDGVWNVYGYDKNDLSLTTAVYSGFYTLTTLGFDTRNGANSWNQLGAPSDAASWSGCALNSESFTVAFKRKGFPCGNYTVAMTSWDDSAIVYIDGVEQWFCSGWSQEGSCNGYVGEFMLNENTEIEIRVREDLGNAFASLSLVNNSETIPGTLTPSGSTSICAFTTPGPITLSGFSGSIVKWQSAADSAFAIDVVDIASTSATLTPAQMGTITSTRYYRAVVQNGGCTPKFPTPVQISVPAPVVYSNSGWSDTPDETKAVVISDDLTLNADIEMCSCVVESGKTLTVAPGVSLTVVNSVIVEPSANLIVEDDGSLVQIADAAINSGNIKVKRKSQPMKTNDYTYWSSPVNGNTLFQLSPLTRFDKYFKFDPIINNWSVILNGAQLMEPGRGYIIRAPQGWTVTNATSGVYDAVFDGAPNNGIVQATIQKGASLSNLIGNPYPSAIDIDLFLTDPANAGIISGTVYFWTHNTAISSSIPGNAIYNYTADDYAKYNLTGGVRSGNPAITGGTIPDGKVASGQGFFIKAGSGLANGTYAATFRNSMRVTGQNGNFYKSGSSSVSTPSQIEKNRLWLDMTNANGAYNEALIGYVTGATNGYDELFDGKIMPAGNAFSLYSISDGENYSILGKALPFNDSDVIPLGYSTTIEGPLSISMPDFDGFFTGQDVFLVDLSTGETHDLKAGAYTFTSGAGTFNTRFELRFVNDTTLGFDAIGVAAVATGSKFLFKAGIEMQYVSVYDISGRVVYSRDFVDATELEIDGIRQDNAVFFIKIKIANGKTAVRKVL